MANEAQEKEDTVELAETDPDEFVKIVESSIKDGADLNNWWEKKDEAKPHGEDFKEHFEVTDVYNRDDMGYSFFDEATIDSGTMQLMGDVPNVYYDQPKYDNDLKKWNEQVREYALKYFMRVADFRLPTAEKDGPEHSGIPQVFADLFGLCTRGFIEREGFGYRQLYFKRQGGDKLERFDEKDRAAIVDTRDLLLKEDEKREDENGNKYEPEIRYEWIVVGVRIYDFDLTVPKNPDLPQISLPLREIAYVILHRDFQRVENHLDGNTVADDGAVGIYQFGYAMLQPTEKTLLAYGPGQFQAGFQLFEFKIFKEMKETKDADGKGKGDGRTEGEIRVRMPFIVNRPEKILDIPLNPISLGVQLADVVGSLGPGGGLSLPAPVKKFADSLPSFGVDPIFGGVALLNILTLGQSSKQLCISREQLEKIMLIQHFGQYYTMVTGTLLTWRQIRDWADEGALPDWVKSGKSA